MSGTAAPWSPDGMPVGIQFAARVGDEATLFNLAGQLERAEILVPPPPTRDPVVIARPHQNLPRPRKAGEGRVRGRCNAVLSWAHG